MKQHPSKEKIINTQVDQASGQADAKIKANTAGKKTVDKKPVFTQTDLKGKKVDGDPSLESDQPVDQLH